MAWGFLGAQTPLGSLAQGLHADLSPGSPGLRPCLSRELPLQQFPSLSIPRRMPAISLPRGSQFPASSSDTRVLWGPREAMSFLREDIYKTATTIFTSS